MLARDTEVAARLAADVRAAGQRALVVAGEHEYGVQLDGQLRWSACRGPTPRPPTWSCCAGSPASPRCERAAATGLPVIAFDGVQGGSPVPGLRWCCPFAPGEDLAGTTAARRAATLIVEALGAGARDRASLLAALRERGPFDEHGDPVDPPVWLWRAAADWTLEPGRALSERAERAGSATGSIGAGR